MLRFNESGFPYFSFGSASTLWERGAYINKVAIATPHGVSGYNDAPLVLSAQDDNQVGVCIVHQLMEIMMGSHDGMIETSLKSALVCKWYTYILDAPDSSVFRYN